MRVITLLVTLVAISCATVRDWPSFIPTAVTAAQFADAGQGEAAEAGAVAGVNYASLLRRAARDTHALRQFVGLCVDSHFDGAALEIHLHHVRDLLVWWGDSRFSTALSEITDDERRILRHTLIQQELRHRGFSSTARLLYATNET